MRSGPRLVLAGAVAVGALVVATESADARDETGEIDTVVTLGDSYSSGVGIHSDADRYDDHADPGHSFDPDTRLGHSACHRETDTTPGPRLAEVLDADSVFIACAGAVIGEIPNQVEAADIEGTGEGTLIVLTIGGNDARTERGDSWGDVILRCVLERDCHKPASNQPANMAQLRDDLTEVLTAIGDEFPDATVRILGYPRLMQRDRWGCLGFTGVSRGEADWIDDNVDRLNLAIGIAASTAKAFTFADISAVDVADEFDNHGACRVWQRDRYVNDTVMGKTYKRVMEDGEVVEKFEDGLFHLSSASVHPSQKGYDAYYDALVESIPQSAGVSSR